ncbi:4282_t:CDS:2, partial [Entrophospora sp. SA101]
VSFSSTGNVFTKKRKKLAKGGFLTADITNPGHFTYESGA